MQRWEESEKRREEERRSKKRKFQKKEDPGAWKGRKVAKLVAPEGRKVGSLKRRGASWPDERWRIARRCGAKHISKSKCTKHTRFGPLLEVEMMKKCTALWHEAHFQVKIAKTDGFGALLEVAMLKKIIFGCSDVVSRGRRKGLCTLSKVSKTRGFCRMSKNYGRPGTFEEDLQRCIFRGRRSTRDMFIRAVRRFGRWFPETGCILEHQIFRFAEMILRAWQAQYFRDMDWK